VARPDVDALRSQVSAAATDPELEPAERVSSLRRLRDLVDMARDQARASLRDQLELIDSLTAIIGSADTYIGDNELRRDAQGMDKALTLARMRENADLHERMVAQGVSPEDLADAGFLTHDEIDEAESDGTIEEAAFGLAARFREWMVKRDHGKFSKKNVAGDAPAAPAARPAAPAPAPSSPSVSGWPAREMPLPIVVRSPQDLTFKTEVERQYLIFNLMAGGRVAFEAGDFALVMEDMAPRRCGNQLAGCTDDEAVVDGRLHDHGEADDEHEEPW